MIGLCLCHNKFAYLSTAFSYYLASLSF